MTTSLHADIERLYKQNRAALEQMSVPERQFLFLRLIMPPAVPVHPLYQQIPYMEKALDQALRSDETGDDSVDANHTSNPAKTLSRLYVALYEQVGANEGRLRQKLKQPLDPDTSDLLCFLASLRDYLARDTLRARFFAQAIVIPALLHATQQSNPYEPAVFGEFVDTLRSKSTHVHVCTKDGEETMDEQSAPFRQLCLLKRIGSGTSGQVYKASLEQTTSSPSSPPVTIVVAVKVVEHDPLLSQRSVWVDAQKVEAQFARIASQKGIGPRFFGHWIVVVDVDSKRFPTDNTSQQRVCFDTSDIADMKTADQHGGRLVSLLATELYSGGTLAQMLDRKEAGGKKAIVDESLVEQLRTKVAALHSLGLVHGDLQPKNVLVSADGKTLALTDWGLSFPVGALPRIPWSALLDYHREQPHTSEFYNELTVHHLLEAPAMIDNGLVDALQKQDQKQPSGNSRLVQWFARYKVQR